MLCVLLVGGVGGGGGEYALRAEICLTTTTIPGRDTFIIIMVIH